MSSTEHHVGMKFTKHPDGRTEVEVHQMPLPGGNQVQGSGMQPQGMVPDPLAAGMKGAIDTAMDRMAPPEKANKGVAARQGERLGADADAENRTVAKKPEAAVGKPPKVESYGKPKAKPDGKNPAKNTEKNQSRAP